MSRRVFAVVAVAAAAAAAVFASLYFTADRGTRTVVERPCGEELFGYIRSLRAGDDGYRLQFDPVLFMTGATANAAAAEDGAVEPGEPVPNDYYVVDESPRTYSYRVPQSARVTVLTNTPEAGDLFATPVTVSQLAELVRGGTPVELFEPLRTGFHIRVHVDTVCELDQQYRP